MPKRHRKFDLPFTPPFSLVGSMTTSLFNAAYFGLRRNRVIAICPFQEFFYPLDNVGRWNRIYGHRGFVQFQCVIPGPEGYAGVARILTLMRESAMGSFLTVLKHMGEKSSGGFLSFHPSQTCESRTEQPDGSGDRHYRRLQPPDVMTITGVIILVIIALISIVQH